MHAHPLAVECVTRVPRGTTSRPQVVPVLGRLLPRESWQEGGGVGVLVAPLRVGCTAAAGVRRGVFKRGKAETRLANAPGKHK